MGSTIGSRSSGTPVFPTPPTLLYLDPCFTTLVARNTAGLAPSFTVSMGRDIELSILTGFKKTSSLLIHSYNS